MTTPIDAASTAVGVMVARFVAAADELVNSLATQPQGSTASKALHQARVDKAYNEYDAARAALVGDPAD